MPQPRMESQAEVEARRRTMAVVCYQSGIVPKDKRVRRIIQNWQLFKLLQMRRRRRESERSRTRMVT